MGLVANLAFYNQLNIQDLHSLFTAGDPSGLAAISHDTPITVSTLRALAQQTSIHDILRVLAPQKAANTAALLQRITALSEYVQSLCGYLAANEELEPAHSVICDLLRTGADFERALNTSPLHLATGVIKHLCSQPDVDGVLPKQLTPGRRPPFPRWPLGVCHAFQRNDCIRPICRFVHECAKCRSPSHGAAACPSPASNRRAPRPAKRNAQRRPTNNRNFD